MVLDVFLVIQHIILCCLCIGVIRYIKVDESRCIIYMKFGAQNYHIFESGLYFFHLALYGPSSVYLPLLLFSPIFCYMCNCLG